MSNKLRLKVRTKLPAALVGRTGIAVVKDGLTYNLDLDYSRLVQTNQSDPVNDLFAVWNKATGVWNTINPASFVAGSFYSAVAASQTVPDGVSLVAIQRTSPSATALTLPLLANQGGKPIIILDWSTSVTSHAITITPSGGATIMQAASKTINSSASQAAAVVLYPSLDLNSWYIAPLSNFLQAGTGAMPRTFQDKARESVSVKDFGAIGDGVANDTVAVGLAIAAAIAAGGTGIYVPKGTYLVESIHQEIDAAHRTHDVSFRGDGPGLSILKLKASSASNGILLIRYADHFTVEGITFDGNGLSINTDALLNGVQCTEVTVQGCEFINYNFCGLAFNTVSKPSILNNSFRRVQEDQFENYGAIVVQTLGTSTDIIAEGNHFENTGSLWYGDGGVLNGNFFKGNGFGAAMSIAAGDASTKKWAVTGNVINGSNGVDANGVAPLGIECGAFGAVITGNSITGMAGAGISIFAPSVVGSNYIENCGTATPFVTGTSTTSLAIGTGSKTLTTQTGKLFKVPVVILAQTVTVSSRANPANFMIGAVTAYNSATGSLTFTCSNIGGSGTFTDWDIVSSAKNAAAIVAVYIDATYNASGSIISGNVAKAGSPNYMDYGYRDTVSTLTDMVFGPNQFNGMLLGRTSISSTAGTLSVPMPDIANVFSAFQTFSGAFNVYTGGWFSGTTSGTVKVLPQAIAGSYNFNLPTTAGTSGYILTSGGGVSAPMTWTNTSGTAYTPTVSPGSGAYTTVTGAGNSIAIGKQVTVDVVLTYTNIGTGGGSTGFSLPVSAAGPAVFVGIEQAVTGQLLIGTVNGAGSVVFRKASDSTPYVPANGHVVIATGTYRSA